MPDARSPRENSELETKTFSVAVLLDAVKKGKVRIARFQRGFIWNDEDRRLLFDSVRAGYPVGTLLLARGAAPADRIALGGYIAAVPSATDALWVVDGQQRLTTLAMALLGDHAGAYRPIFFDLESDNFVLGPRKRSAPPRWIPTQVLSSSATLNRWLREANLPDELSDRADKIAGRIRDYIVPAYLVPFDGQDDRLLRGIFARVNRGGRALKSHEVFEALHASSAGGKPIERAGKDLLSLGFGPVAPSAIEVAAVAVVTGKTGRSLVEVVDEERTDVEEVFNRVVVSLSSAIAFLAGECGVPHVELLPFEGALSTLARFFSLHPHPHARNLELMARWFWRGTVTGDHRRDNRIDGKRWQAINKDENASVQRLLKLLPPVTETHLGGSLQPYRSNNARSRIELLAMCDLGPRVLGGEERGTLVPIAAILTDSPANLPSTLTETRAEPERSSANYLIHPKISVQEMIDNAPTAEVLASHSIEPRAWEALKGGDLSEFVEQRKSSLARHLGHFLRECTGADAADRDRLPLDSYFVEESA